MTKAYKYSIVYFLVFSLLLILSGVLLFEYKIGFSVEQISSYYLGDEDKFINPQTSSSILKIITPHIFAFGLFIMVLLHFLIFTKKRSSKTLKAVIYLTFLSAILELLSPFGIINNIEFFAYVKLLSFIIFELLVLFSSWLLFRSIVYE
ncbi:MAG: hypothetical protein J7K14_01580 [Sulfurimonas sp.]|nr:hypothetical protein [Sulfurimonas sp.]